MVHLALGAHHAFRGAVCRHAVVRRGGVPGCCAAGDHDELLLSIVLVVHEPGHAVSRSCFEAELKQGVDSTQCVTIRSQVFLFVARTFAPASAHLVRPLYFDYSEAEATASVSLLASQRATIYAHTLHEVNHKVMLAGDFQRQLGSAQRHHM